MEPNCTLGCKESEKVEHDERVDCTRELLYAVWPVQVEVEADDDGLHKSKKDADRVELPRHPLSCGLVTSNQPPPLPSKEPDQHEYNGDGEDGVEHIIGTGGAFATEAVVAIVTSGAHEVSRAGSACIPCETCSGDDTRLARRRIISPCGSTVGPGGTCGTHCRSSSVCVGSCWALSALGWVSRVDEVAHLGLQADINAG